MRRSQQEDQQKKAPSSRRQLPMSSQPNKNKRKTPPAAAPAVAASKKKKGKQPRASPTTVASGTNRKPRNFGNIEDQLLCRAYVNVSCNPIKGTDQKRNAFWESIKTKYEELYVSENVTEDGPKEERDWEALANRYQKKIQPEMNLFMPFLKRVYGCPPSGVPKEEYPNIAATDFHEHYDRPFKFLHCVAILKQLPKFDPESGVDEEAIIEIDDDDDGEDDGDKKPSAKPSATNKIGNPMGANMARPIGQKAAKKALAAKPVEDAKAAALSNLATSHARLATVAENQSDMEYLFTEFKMYQDLGMTGEAQNTLAKLREAREEAKRSRASLAVVPASATSASTSPPVRNVMLQNGDEDNVVDMLEDDLPEDFDGADDQAAL